MVCNYYVTNLVGKLKFQKKENLVKHSIKPSKKSVLFSGFRKGNELELCLDEPW